MSNGQDICVIACYFNPTNSQRRKANFFEFHRRLVEAGIEVFVIEQTTGQSSSVLQGVVKNLHVVNAGGILWQKERLLNRIAAMVPKRFEKIVWSDVDLLFGDDPRAWITAVSKKLDDFVVVQGFSVVERLPENLIPTNAPDLVTGFAKVLGEWSEPYPVPADYPVHGHTGYVWAARRSLFESCGLYDACMSGSGDHLMAHAFCGDLESDCFNQTFQSNDLYRKHFMMWAERVADLTSGELGWVEYEVQHLWHGNPKDRRYRERENEIIELNFNPSKDLILTEHGAWDWSSEGRRLVPWAKEYFLQRKEN